MLISLTRGQFFESLFPEAPASTEALTSFLRQRYSVGAYTPEITIEGDLSHIHIDEAEVGQPNETCRYVDRWAELMQSSELAMMIGGLKEEITGFSKDVRIDQQSFFLFLVS